MNTLFWIGLIVYFLLLVSTATVVVLENRQPAKTIAWLVVIIFLPVVGLIVFAFFGQDFRRKRILNKNNYKRIWDAMMASTQQADEQNMPVRCAELARFLNASGHTVLTGDNALEVLPSGADYLAALLKDIYAAKEHIHIETYIIEDDAVGRLVRDALIDRRRDNVEVRLLYDHVGCWNVPHKFFESMQDAGIMVEAFMPVRFPSLTRHANYRNHRKVCVFDGRVGYIGGMNLATRYVSNRLGHWRDMQVRVRGGLVNDLQSTFLALWYFTTGRLRDEKRFFPEPLRTGEQKFAQLASSAPVSDVPDIMYAIVWMIQNAKKSVYIQTPYLMPPAPVLQAIQTAALAGVEVHIILPQKPDAFLLRWANDSYFTPILEAGAHIHLFEGGFMHAKVVVMDDECCTVGSANIDFRSFENNFEENIFVYDSETTQRVKQVVLADMANSREVDAEEWAERPMLRRYFESYTRIFSPLL